MAKKSKKAVTLNSLEELYTYLYDWAQNNENVENIKGRENCLNQNITFPFNYEMKMVVFSLHADTTKAAVNRFLDVAEGQRILSTCFEVGKTKKGDRLALRVYQSNNKEKSISGWYCYDSAQIDKSAA